MKENLWALFKSKSASKKFMYKYIIWMQQKEPNNFWVRFNISEIKMDFNTLHLHSLR